VLIFATAKGLPLVYQLMTIALTDKLQTGGLVVRWVTTSESPLLYVLGFFWKFQKVDSLYDGFFVEFCFSGASRSVALIRFRLVCSLHSATDGLVSLFFVVCINCRHLGELALESLEVITIALTKCKKPLAIA